MTCSKGPWLKSNQEYFSYIVRVLDAQGVTITSCVADVSPPVLNYSKHNINSLFHDKAGENIGNMPICLSFCHYYITFVKSTVGMPQIPFYGFIFDCLLENLPFILSLLLFLFVLVVYL